MRAMLGQGTHHPCRRQLLAVCGASLVVSLSGLASAQAPPKAAEPPELRDGVGSPKADPPEPAKPEQPPFAESLGEEARNAAAPPALGPGPAPPVATTHEIVMTRSESAKRMMQNGWTWDLNLEAGYGHVFSSPPGGYGFVRARTGLAYVRDPVFETLGLTVEHSGLAPLAFGLQGELTWVQLGPWVQGGALLDVDGRPGALVAGGYAIWGLEMQYRDAESTGAAFAIYGKLRFPVSIFVRWLTTRPSASEVQ